MAAVEITISGVLFDKYNRTQQNVVLIGEAMITGLQVGGGPMPPGGGSPPNYPNIPPHPAFPIAGGPGAGFPDKPGYPPVVGGGPIIPDTPPPDPVQPPIEWKAVWAGPENGWVVVGIPQVPHPSPS